MAYRVRGYRGIAFSKVGEDEDGKWKMVMVGDDRVFHEDPDDCTKLKNSEFCYECGQIGCQCSVTEDE